MKSFGYFGELWNEQCKGIYNEELLKSYFGENGGHETIGYAKIVHGMCKTMRSWVLLWTFSVLF